MLLIGLIGFGILFVAVLTVYSIGLAAEGVNASWNHWRFWEWDPRNWLKD